MTAEVFGAKAQRLSRSPGKVAIDTRRIVANSSKYVHLEVIPPRSKTGCRAVRFRLGLDHADLSARRNAQGRLRRRPGESRHRPGDTCHLQGGGGGVACGSARRRITRCVNQLSQELRQRLSGRDLSPAAGRRRQVFLRRRPEDAELCPGDYPDQRDADAATHGGGRAAVHPVGAVEGSSAQAARREPPAGHRCRAARLDRQPLDHPNPLRPLLQPGLHGGRAKDLRAVPAGAGEEPVYGADRNHGVRRADVDGQPGKPRFHGPSALRRGAEDGDGGGAGARRRALHPVHVVAPCLVVGRLQHAGQLLVEHGQARNGRGHAGPAARHAELARLAGGPDGGVEGDVRSFRLPPVRSGRRSFAARGTRPFG